MSNNLRLCPNGHGWQPGNICKICQKELLPEVKNQKVITFLETKLKSRGKIGKLILLTLLYTILVFAVVFVLNSIIFPNEFTSNLIWSGVIAIISGLFSFFVLDWPKYYLPNIQQLKELIPNLDKVISGLEKRKDIIIKNIDFKRIAIEYKGEIFFLRPDPRKK